MSDLSNVRESLSGVPQVAAAGEVAWLAEGEIPKAAVTLLSGEPGSGKSFVACTLAATVSQLPDARVMIAHSEPAERLHARLGCAGAKDGRITLLSGGTPAPQGKPAVRLDVLIASLSAAVSVTRDLDSAAKPTDLIVIDDLENWCGKALSAAELAEATAALNELARTSGAAVLAVVRSATTTEGRVTARSLDRLMRAADVVWMVSADRETTGRRWLVPLKNNLAAPPRGKTFQIFEGRVQWLAEDVPDDALTPGSRPSAQRADRQTAGAWLVEALLLQDVPSRLLYAQARQCGFSRNTILRAAHRMGLHSHKSAFDGCWKYSLSGVPREVVDRFRPRDPVFGKPRAEGFRIGVGGRGSGDGEGFGIQDSAFSTPETVGQTFQPDAAEPKPIENAENRSKSTKSPKKCESQTASHQPRSARPVTSHQPLVTLAAPNESVVPILPDSSPDI